ncbi:outer membrane protein assembly factor BamB family protein [Brevibacterium casei]|uniref:outer membrane protein assembly factor BamB family protein n=1 Tax=Brevibacterium casei TaxID=33889 RepID=UPI00223A8141|nr:PQQ-binding-like beta-propeller repeat protein [Brevibacterium casei]MCT1550053.1 PQQ-binding-like beta-propeller repeat protein [Brevibacterium casei]MCT1559264.1 PQQ-binding-like beta-propeller repeat protein [Brevibacterium casei]MCT2207999.1 PQQ-binding-like beta-propeller repeat protein [Brevibacterium casei]
MSDGITVTATRHDGTFEITPRGPFVFVTRPAGWECERWYMPSDRTVMHFVLTRRTETYPYRFAHISDMHLGKGAYYPHRTELGTKDRLGSFLRRVAELEDGLSSFVATGDLTDSGIASEFTSLRNAVDVSPVGVHLLPGNHDHMAGALDRAVSPGGYVLHSADPSAYERFLGPRWYSFDLPGLHVVAVDWHTHEFGIDTEQQNAWMRADLESQPPGTPWILLSHDQPWHTMLDGLPRPPLATFSGHRHVSRVIEVGGVLHVTTPTPLFAGLDGSEPAYRVVTWDGTGLSLSSKPSPKMRSRRSVMQVNSRELPHPRSSGWKRRLAGTAHRATVCLLDDLVAVPVYDDDRGTGGVVAVRRADGADAWRTMLPSAVKATPVAAREGIIVSTVDGQVFCLDRLTGAIRWHDPSPDPLRTFCFAAPAVAGGRVFAGDPFHIRALDAETGALLWERRALAPYQTFANAVSPVVHRDTVIIGQWPATSSLLALDAETGDIRWGTAEETDELLGSDAPIGTPAVDPDTGDLFAPMVSGVARLDPTCGRSVWFRPGALPWNPSTPLPVRHGIAVSDAGRGLVLLDRDSGRELWTATHDDGADTVMCGYQTQGHAVYASACALGENLVLPGLDMCLRLVNGLDGASLGRVDLDAPIAAAPVSDGNAVYVLDTSGTLTCFDRSAFTGDSR